MALISALMFSRGGEAFVIRWFELMAWANDVFGLIALQGLVFICGLPGFCQVEFGPDMYVTRQWASQSGRITLTGCLYHLLKEAAVR